MKANPNSLGCLNCKCKCSGKGNCQPSVEGVVKNSNRNTSHLIKSQKNDSTMITTTNYFQTIKDIDHTALPKDLYEGYKNIMAITKNHTTWKLYKDDADIKDFVDEYFTDLWKYVKSMPNKIAPRKAEVEKEARKAAKSLIWNSVTSGQTVQQLKASAMGRSGGIYDARINAGKIHVTELKGKKVNYSFPIQSIYNEILDEQGISNSPIKKQEVKPTIKSEQETLKVEEVERISDEIRFIKRYTLLHGKEKNESQILSFLNSLQRAILEKRIRKTSDYAKHIVYIQQNLINLLDHMKKIKDPYRRRVKIEVDSKILREFKGIGAATRVRLSTSYLKRYVGMQDRFLTKDKAARLLDVIKKAAASRKIMKSDPYAENLTKVASSLNQFINSAKMNETLEIHQTTLNGIEDALAGCGCELDGLPENNAMNVLVPENQLMSSMDFSNMKFNTLGFEGKWKELIGDPSEGFSAMVFGKPKMGKSYLCMDWAGYLARNHGDTLYVAKEEKLNATLQKKLMDKNVAHPCLFVSDHLPTNLRPYQFIFLDSVNKLGLKPEDLDSLKAQNPGKSFIDVHQTTKEGNFRGANEYQHDVDVVIEVPEKGKALQFGRFNQGGEMQIFN